MNSGTPRTDAEYQKIDMDTETGSSEAFERMRDFARQLERELAATKAELSAIKQAYYIPDYVPRKQLDDAKAEIAKLTECVRAADEMRNFKPNVLFSWQETIERYDSARKAVKA